MIHDLPGRQLALARWSTYPDSKEYLDCRVVFDRNPMKVKTSFVKFCATVVHEFGHLNGRGHSRDPYNIMYYQLTMRNIPPICERL